MNRKITSPIPEAIVQLQRQLDPFRSTQPQRTKLPESLWQAAVELARQYGIYPTAPVTPPEECVIEFESTRGGKVRIQWKASTPPDWLSYCVPGGKRKDDSDRAADTDSGWGGSH